MSDEKQDNVLPPERIWIEQGGKGYPSTEFFATLIDNGIEYIRVSDLLVWLDAQLTGIHRDFLFDYNDGALNAFAQIRRKLMGISVVDKLDPSAIASRRHAFQSDSRAPEVCNKVVSLKDPYYCQMKRGHPIHLSDDVVNDRRVPFETDDKR